MKDKNKFIFGTGEIKTKEEWDTLFLETYKDGYKAVIGSEDYQTLEVINKGDVKMKRRTKEELEQEAKRRMVMWSGKYSLFQRLNEIDMIKRAIEESKK